MDCQIHPSYFPNIAHFVAMDGADVVLLEVCDNYQKQTFRNRMDIYGANGKLSLTVPVSYTQKNRQAFKDVLIYNDSKWQIQHLKSLKAAYEKSPFFEFYIDDIAPLFETKFKFLLDLNLRCLEVLANIMEFPLVTKKTETFQSNLSNITDCRNLVNPKISLTLEPYVQMFSHKFGFMENLSILDLLFNEGPASQSYLKQQGLNP